MTIDLPALPMEHTDVDLVYLDEKMDLHAMRCVRSIPDTPDMIQLCFNSHSGTATVFLTPAMLVHLANTQLTDTERAAIDSAEEVA